MRQDIPLREITIEEIYKDVQALRNELQTHTHLDIGGNAQLLTGEVKGILHSPNFVSGSAGWQLLPDGTLEANSGNFRGDISGASGTFTGSISIGSGNNIFKADANGIYLGNATFASAPFRVSMTGVGIFTDITATGTINALGGYVGSATAIIYESTGMNIGTTGHMRGGQTDFATGIGWFIGYTGGAYKFSIGNPAANYLTWDGSTLDVTAARYIELFEAGENITDGNIVCVKPSYTDFFPTDDAYTWEYTPDTNYGTAVTMFTGLGSSQKNYISWLKFSMVAVPAVQFILKATLRIKVYQIIGNPTVPTIYRVTGDDWWEVDNAHTGITYTNQPSTTDDIPNYGSQKTDALPGLDEWLELDVTYLVRNWKAGDLNNYGIQLKVATPGTVNNFVQWHSVDAANAADKPVLRIYASNASDRKVYKADSSDYFLSRTIIGVAQEAITSGNTGKIQTHGKVNNVGATGSGSRVYLSNAPGGITSDTSNAYRVILLGKSIVAGTMVLNIQDQDIFISKPYSKYWATYGAIKYYVPADTRYVRVVGDWTDIYGTITNQMDVYRGISEGNSRNLTIHHAGTTFSHINITWLANYVTINGSAETSAQLYFYT